MRWMKIAELSLRKDFTAAEGNETLGERFKEFTSHSAWSLLKATWISTLISKASRSSTQNSDHPQLSHTFRPPSRVKGSLVDPKFPISLILLFPDPVESQHRRELPILAGSLGWRGRWEEKATALQLTWPPCKPTQPCKALQGRWTLGNLRHRQLPSDGGDKVPRRGQRSPTQMCLALGRSLRKEITCWREAEPWVAPWWGAAHLPCLCLPGNPVKSEPMETVTGQQTGNPGISTTSLQFKPWWQPSHTSKSPSHDPHPFLSSLSPWCSGWKISIHL